MKVQNLKTRINPFAGISLVNYHFNKSGLSQLIDNELRVRVKTVGYQYGEIFRNLTNVFLCGGDVIEDINTHLGELFAEYCRLPTVLCVTTSCLLSVSRRNYFLGVTAFVL